MREFLADGCSDVGDVEARRKAIAASGYRLVGDLVLPAAGWWENYYVPLGECLERFRRSHAGDHDALEVADRSQHEIELYQRHRDAFGYAFFVMKRD